MSVLSEPSAAWTSISAGLPVALSSHTSALSVLAPAAPAIWPSWPAGSCFAMSLAASFAGSTVSVRCSASTPLRCSGPTYVTTTPAVLELLLELRRIEVLELVDRARGPAGHRVQPAEQPLELLRRAELEPAGEIAGRHLAGLEHEQREDLARDRALHVQALPVEDRVELERVARDAERTQRGRLVAERGDGQREVEAALAGLRVDDDLDRLGRDRDGVLAGRGRPRPGSSGGRAGRRARCPRRCTASAAAAGAVVAGALLHPATTSARGTATSASPRRTRVCMVETVDGSMVVLSSRRLRLPPRRGTGRRNRTPARPGRAGRAPAGELG